MSSNRQSSPSCYSDLMTQFQRELQELKILSICTLTVILSWFLFLGWNGHTLLGGMDNTAMVYPYVKELFRQGGDAWNYPYNPKLLGGSKIYGILGWIPLYSILSRLGFSPAFAESSLTFFIQIIFSYFGIHSVLSFSKLKKTPNLLTLMGLTWILGFAPVLAWRITMGHQNLLLGAFAFLLGLSFLKAITENRITLVYIVLSFFAWIHCLSGSGQQLVFYSLIFGFPIFLANTSPSILNKNSIILLFVFLSGFFVSLPHVLAMLNHLSSGDAARSLTGEIVAYSNNTSEFMEWVSSLLWTKGWVLSFKPIGLAHEINYPMGPLILILAVFPWKSHRKLGVGILVSLVTAVLFSMNVTFVSSPLFLIFSPLKYFRVPARAIFPFVVTFLILACSFLLQKFEEPMIESNSKKKITPQRQSFQSQLLSILTGVGVLLLSDPIIREILLWIGIAILALSIYRSRLPTLSFVAPAVIFSLIGFGSLLAFKERLAPYPTVAELETDLQNVSQTIIANAVQLKDPFNRVHVDFNYPHYFSNTTLAMNLSSLDGYWFAPRRFISLAQALKAQPYSPMFTNFQFATSSGVSADFNALRQLYNVRTVAQLSSQNQLSITDFKNVQEVAGQAWFSTSLQTYESFEKLAQEMLGANQDLGKVVKAKLMLVLGDPQFPPEMKVPNDFKKCSEAKILSIETMDDLHHFKIQTSTPSQCPLTLAMNYVSEFVARQSNGTVLPVFPSYGALTTIWVPEGKQDIVLAFETQSSSISKLMTGFGYLLFFISCGWLYLTSRKPNKAILPSEKTT